MQISEQISAYLRQAATDGASDVHITSKSPAKERICGELIPFTGQILSPLDVKEMLLSLMDDDEKRSLEQNGDADFSCTIDGAGRFRVSVFQSIHGLCGVFRLIQTRIPSPEELLVPQAVVSLCDRKRGLVLVTGPTGSGKSTTLASLIGVVNHTRKGHIITLEDPVEYLHNSVECTVVQREVGANTESFARGLKAALREDPDVILVGEMRDYETISTAIRASETGHLVFSTLHTTGAAETIGRIVSTYPSLEQKQARADLSDVLEAVISEQLVPKIGGGRIAVFEVCMITPKIREIIREGNTKEIKSEVLKDKVLGSISMDDALMTLYFQKKIERQVAYDFAVDKASMGQKLGM